ncbi:MAG TPA: M28 family peptidase [Planktothrix sp.]
MLSIFAWSGIIVALALIVLAAVLKSRTRVMLTAISADTPISSVHPKRKGPCCKFDPSEVKRTRNLRKPKIDISNLPPADPRVVKLMNALSATDIEKALKELSGEIAVTINGTATKITSRNSYSKGLSSTVDYLKQFYAKLNKFTVTVDSYRKGGKTLYNVIAEIKGKKTPNKVFILGAHMDSTAGNTWTSESVAPGADDDGTGTVALLQLALALQTLDPGLTVRLCHFSGEEQGLWGSAVYSDKIANAKTQLVSTIQIDMIGYCAKPGNRVDIHDNNNQNGSHALVEQMVRNVARYKLNLNAVDTHNTAVEGRSDASSFLDHGYTAVLVSEEFSDDGFNPNYHSTGDRVKALNIPYMVEVVKMVMATVVDIAQA